MTLQVPHPAFPLPTSPPGLASPGGAWLRSMELRGPHFGKLRNCRRVGLPSSAELDSLRQHLPDGPSLCVSDRARWCERLSLTIREDVHAWHDSAPVVPPEREALYPKARVTTPTAAERGAWALLAEFIAAGPLLSKVGLTAAAVAEQLSWWTELGDVLCGTLGMDPANLNAAERCVPSLMHAPPMRASLASHGERPAECRRALGWLAPASASASAPSASRGASEDVQLRSHACRVFNPALRAGFSRESVCVCSSLPVRLRKSTNVATVVDGCCG